MFWGEKPYHSLDYEMKQRFVEKVYRLSLNGGMTCPNRDGTAGTGGCIFCSAGGSGDFAAPAVLPISEQLRMQKELIAKKRPVHKYIAYFQAYTNTYAPVQHLRRLFEEAVSDPEVCVLSIATRPDCLGEDVIALLTELNLQKPVWVELGLQTIHPKSADFIRRGYPLSVFEDAVTRLRNAGIEVIVHTILFLPGETPSQMLDTIRYLNTQDIQGIKLQLLHVLKQTDLASYYKQHPFPLPSLEEYLELLGACICTIRPNIVIHRITGDGPKSLLIAPLWTSDKRNVLNQTARYFKEHDIWQGKYTEDDKSIS